MKKRNKRMTAGAAALALAVLALVVLDCWAVGKIRYFWMGTPITLREIRSGLSERRIIPGMSKTEVKARWGIPWSAERDAVTGVEIWKYHAKEIREKKDGTETNLYDFRVVFGPDGTVRKAQGPEPRGYSWKEKGK